MPASGAHTGVAGTPAFWWRGGSWQSLCLSPLSALYGFFSARPLRALNGFRAAVPVLCVGNFTLGGAGKTPTALRLARAAKEQGLKPGFLSRGYGGSLPGPVAVMPGQHGAAEVGDEPLLLAREALTVVSRHRVDGARMLAEMGVDLILMDDGFQSARVYADYALIVVDARRGVGNGAVFPAGPLRAPLEVQMAAASALLLAGEGEAGEALALRVATPVFRAGLTPAGAAELAGRRVLAFAGIADPAKFHRTLCEIGAQAVVTRDFADHAHLSDQDIERLLTEAQAAGLMLVTTAKDAARLGGRQGRAVELLARATVVDVEMTFADPHAPATIIAAAMAAGRSRLPG